MGDKDKPVTHLGHKSCETCPIKKLLIKEKETSCPAGNLINYCRFTSLIAGQGHGIEIYGHKRFFFVIKDGKILYIFSLPNSDEKCEDKKKLFISILSRSKLSKNVKVSDSMYVWKLPISVWDWHEKRLCTVDLENNITFSFRWGKTLLRLW